MCGLLVMDLWFLMVYRVSVLLSLKMKYYRGELLTCLVLNTISWLNILSCLGYRFVSNKWFGAIICSGILLGRLSS